MYQLVYASEATEAFSPDFLEDLLKLARANNRIKRITGMLVFYDRQFLQVLEGNPADVIGMYDQLATDPRHDNLVILHRGYSNAGKTFTGLSMGFHALALNDKLLDGFVVEQFSFYQFDGLTALDFLLSCRSTQT